MTSRAIKLFELLFQFIIIIIELIMFMVYICVLKQVNSYLVFYIFLVFLFMSSKSLVEQVLNRLKLK